jgi:hypothetical protein
MVNERRAAYKNKDDQKYEEIVMTLQDLSENLSDRVLTVAAEQIGLNNQDIYKLIEDTTANDYVNQVSLNNLT